ncbi:MAG TPA: efflux transporter outer membrane subunit [Terriglobales bacterium]|jgi:NodT family efflux transporter outer membrane factor (OMF) lipoprotein
MRHAAAFTGALSALLMISAGCAVGPRYARPSATTPPQFKEIPENWKTAQPSDSILRGKWWEVYQDPQLNQLEEKINLSNQTLKAAQSQFMQARALVRQSRADYYPTVSGGAAVSRNLQSSNRALSSLTTTTNYTDITLPLDVSYEPDLWGRVRKSVEAARANAQASAADLESVSLSLHSELALDYFALRTLDADAQLLESNVAAFEKALELTQNRYKGGVASQVDVAFAKTQLETTRAQAIDVQQQRAAFEHAIATLVGEPTSTFSLARLPLDIAPPIIPVGVPSQLLERRPDVAGAERRIAVANAQIGVAKSSYFPLLSLTGAGGFESSTIGNLLTGPSGFYSVAASVVETAFDGGRRAAVSDQAWAAYHQSVDIYRQSLLTAFQEVEDNLAALRILEQESHTQDEAVAAAQQSLQLANNRYKGGVATYLEVITSESLALSDQRTAVDIAGRRMSASVLLIKALGGGWDASSLQNIDYSERPDHITGQ